MIDVKIDKGVSTMTFAGSGLEIAVLRKKVNA